MPTACYKSANDYWKLRDKDCCRVDLKGADLDVCLQSHQQSTATPVGRTRVDKADRMLLQGHAKS
eukprot:5628794-Amphidinium_carterae.1